MYFLGVLLLLCVTFRSHGFMQSYPLRIGGAACARPPVCLQAKLWERMAIEEDEEPMWYLLNCVAGLELDLLRQCMQVTEDMEDVKKLVVPTVSSTRSHGANRMVTDTKVQYQGYVFAKLRLCEQTYEAIQGLDLCRSWMGTVNQKGYKKLPPAPVALNEMEIENFGLEEMEELDECDDIDDNIIVDTEDEDKAAAAIEKEVQTTYLGLRVEDMIKVTAKNKFFDEDGIVRRLKGGEIMVRFFTYGSMYEEWLDPGDVRKLSDEEVIKGLGGPSQPITQQDIDGPKTYDRDNYGKSSGESRRNIPGSLAGGGLDRNRRQDRNAGRFRQGDSLQDQNREQKNWDWYKDNQRRSRDGAHADGEFDMRGSSAQGDVDAQWGRGPPRESRDRPQPKRDERPNSGTGGDDWSAFVSPASPSSSKTETDDFFDSLMTDLSKDVESEKGSGDAADSPGGSDEDDFFASLMSEIADEEEASSPPKNSKPPKPATRSDDDDFFASLEKEIQGAAASEPTKATGSSADDDLDSFFAEIGSFDESGASSSSEAPNTAEPTRSSQSSTNNDLDNFFAEIGSIDDSTESTVPTPQIGDVDDFFADLEAELEAELASIMPDESSTEESATSSVENNNEAEKRAAKKNWSTHPPTSTGLDASDLQKCTVPVLKDMLRDRGMKVSGKKSELIERLKS